MSLAGIKICIKIPFFNFRANVHFHISTLLTGLNRLKSSMTAVVYCLGKIELFAHQCLRTIVNMLGVVTPLKVAAKSCAVK